MYFVQKIYYNNKPLILTNDSASYLKEHPVAAGYLSLTGAFMRNYRLAIDHLDKPRTLGAVIEDLSPKELQAQLHQLYTPIDAAGGVVRNEHDEVLMIYRRGKWDLPKGKRDDGENMAECALREVSEETGLKKIKLGDKICDTYHVYAQNNKQLLKRTAWYHMEASVKEILEPQTEENILEARWIQEDELAPVVFKTYDAIKEVLQEAGINWMKQ
jgi:8-oxo-dGTP pyrophosphatase MutT (NUDIX family)